MDAGSLGECEGRCWILSPVGGHEGERRRSEAKHSEQRPGDEAQHRHHVGCRDNRETDDEGHQQLLRVSSVPGSRRRTPIPIQRAAPTLPTMPATTSAGHEWHDDDPDDRHHEQREQT